MGHRVVGPRIARSFLASTFCAFQPAAFSQTLGEITGRVTDPSAAAVPPAVITLTSVATNAVRTTVSTEAGDFTPICCGENFYMRWGFREILEKRAADIIMPDFQKTGGLLEARKTADMAHAYYVPVAPYAVTSPLGMMATAHVCAVIPNFLVQEWHWIDSMDLWRNWVKEGEIIERGFITMPERPGIGVEVNDEEARRAQVPGTPRFEPVKRG